MCDMGASFIKKRIFLLTDRHKTIVFAQTAAQRAEKIPKIYVNQ